MGATTRFLALLTPSPLLLHHHRHQFRLSLLRLSSSVSHRRRSSHSEFTVHSSPPLFFSSSSSKRPSSSSRQGHLHTQSASSYYGSSSSSPNHPWPEFYSLLDNLSAAGYFSNRQGGESELFVDDVNLPEEFMNAAIACLAFARDSLNLVWMLSRRDLEVVVQNGTPFLFKDGEDSSRRMKLYLSTSGNNVSSTDSVNTVDLMKFLLSYVSNSPGANHFYNRELVDSSIRNLLLELAKLSSSTPKFNSGSGKNQFLDKFEQTSRPYGQTIEMKRGDWICTRCSFMNFARNLKCLECEEARPKKQLTGGEWECPQCSFYNYPRNMMCLRCDCKRPGQVSANGGVGTGSYASQIDIDSRLAANEEKAQRWFAKVSQLDSADISEIPDEDFPEIMPLRKGVNRFVVSTRKTPLERRLENAQYRRNSGNDNKPEASDTSVSRRLDKILGSSSTVAPLSYSEGSNSNSVPFVPLPADMFKKKSDPQTKEGENTVSDSSHINIEPKENVRAEKYDGGFKMAADRNNITSATPAKDFPAIMPMREENRFIKQNDRSQTSPRRAAMEQTSSNNNYVSFVPFPPGHFANNSHRQPDGVDSHKKSSSELSNSTLPENKMNSSAHFAANQPISSGSGTTTPSSDSQYSNNSRASGYSVGANVNSSANFAGNSPQQSDNQNVRDSWKGKSLEGSAVKEPDPLDMSEEAKAERWFRRVAQIKDISELSQIPDEDFPSIMPMRKGVNRFVVSKRKTPLERRLTSQQYRRNLPVVSSDPLKKENDSN